jgi:hypothetical protein
MQEYSNDILTYTANNSVRSDCADITFYNSGYDNVIINSAIVIFPNGSFTLNANAGEIDRTIYNFKFEGANNLQQLTVIRKTYV